MATPTDHGAEPDDEFDRAAVAHRLHELRLEKKLSMSQLARLARTSQATIAGLENGSRMPTLYVLNGIAQALGLRLRLSFDAISSSGAIAAAALPLRVPKFLANWMTANQLPDAG